MLPDQSDIGPALPTTLRLARMLCAIKDVNLAGNSLRRDEVRILGHITRPVDLALVVDFLDNVDTRLWRDGMATELAALVIVVRPVEFICGGAIITLREVYFGNLEVVLGLAGRVRAEQEAMDCVGLVRWPVSN